MRIGCLVRRVGVAAALAVVAVPIPGMQGASAAPVSPGDFTCGITVFTPCNQTAHFSTIDNVGTPLQTAEPACPPQVSVDFVTMVGTGNGIEHSIVNNAGDAWFTSTFSGNATLTAYPPSSIDNSDPKAAAKPLRDLAGEGPEAGIWRSDHHRVVSLPSSA
jgi:hypothetical protein